MVKFLKPNKAVILLQGRYAGRKAVIVKNYDDGVRDRAYGHCLVAGIKKYPGKVIKKDSAKKTAKKSRVKCFVKLVNYRHLMPTRYTLDVDLKDVVSLDAFSTKDQKVTASKGVKAKFEERFKTGKNSLALVLFVTMVHQGRFLLAAVSGRILARSFHSVLQVGHEIIAQALGIGEVQVPETVPEMTWTRMELSVMLEHVQAHVAPTDVDPGAGVQWLPKIPRENFYAL